MTTGSGRDADADFSLGRMVAKSLGAAVAVLVVAVPIIWWAARSHQGLALGIAIGAIVVMLAVMALVARYELRHVQAEIDRLKAGRDGRADDTGKKT